MSVLFIGPNEKEAIKVAIELARACPVPLEVLERFQGREPVTLLKLSDRKPGETDFRDAYPSQQVMLGTYRCALSFEQQPYGLVRHLSISSWRVGAVPGPEVLHMVAKEFGFSNEFAELLLSVRNGNEPAKLSRPAFVWAEEFDPGHVAINITEADEAGAAA